jgi:magnesium-transporting ATPase (P-type)
MTFVIWVITGDHKPTAKDAANADVILKLNPPSARLSMLRDDGRAMLVKWPNVPPERP